MTDETLLKARRDGVRPLIGAGIEAGYGLVVAAQELGHADQGFVSERPVRIGLDRRFARDVGENLAAAAIDAQIPGSALEPDALQMAKECPGGLAGRALRTPDCVADAGDSAGVRRATMQEHLSVVGGGSAHGGPSSSRASEAWVIRLVAKPPCTAARTAGALATP